MANFARFKRSRYAYSIDHPNLNIAKYALRKKLRAENGWLYFTTLEKALDFHQIFGAHIDGCDVNERLVH